MPEPDEPKKETVRITLPSRGPTSPSEKHDTAQINLPIAPETSEETSSGPSPPPSRSGPSLARPPLTPATAQTVAPPRRMVPPPPMPVSPAKLPVTPPLPSRIAQAPLRPAPAPPVVATSPARSGSAAQPKKEASRIDTIAVPKKETSRINLVSDQPAKSVRMSKTQPLVTVIATPVTPPLVPVRVAPVVAEPPSIISSIPTGLCWALVLISAAILIIEIWTYIS